MSTIKWHIDNGHYPKNERGYQVAITNSGHFVEILDTNGPEGLEITGRVGSSNSLLAFDATIGKHETTAMQLLIPDSTWQDKTYERAKIVASGIHAPLDLSDARVAVKFYAEQYVRLIDMKRIEDMQKS